MINFRRMSIFERLLLCLSRKRRQTYDAQLLAAIERLVADPELPCAIEGIIVRAL